MHRRCCWPPESPMPLGDIEIDVLERVEFAVIEIERANRHLGGRERRVGCARFDRGSGKRGHGGHRAIRWRNNVRARTFNSNTVSVINSAPAHANCCQSLYGLIANWKMTTGKFAIGALKFDVQN